MYVKMRTGKFAGEVKDLRSDVALEFMKRGEAERAFQDPPTPVGVTNGPRPEDREIACVVEVAKAVQGSARKAGRR